MKRQIIQIDRDKCNGCGLCVDACHEGAIGMVDGRAQLLRDDYCDGLGDCLPVCPTGAISFCQREALAFDPAAVAAGRSDSLACGCPSTHARAFLPQQSAPSLSSPQPSQLGQWPVQLALVPANAPFFEGANVVVAADCSAYACADFHQRFMRGAITLIGCPKLDQRDYQSKLTQIFLAHNIASVTVVRMSVPCCSGLERAVTDAIVASARAIPLEVHILQTSRHQA